MTIRFGTMHVPGSSSEWLETAKTAEPQGYHTLLLPDNFHVPSPYPALAAAAAVTGTLRLRPNVIAAPLRSVAEIVRESATLQLLSDGRFELGIGVGRPDAQQETEQLERQWGSATQRRAHVLETVAAVRSRVDPAPPVMIAAAGPRMLAAAAQVADRILPALIATAREATDRPVAFTQQIVGVGELLFAPRVYGQVPDIAELRAAGAVGLLPADPADAAAVLEYRQDKYGIDEVIVPGGLADAFQPILDRLR